MTVTAAMILAVLALAVAAAIAARDRPGSPRLAATTHLVGLAGLVLLPAAAVSCGIAALLAHGAFGCGPSWYGGAAIVGVIPAATGLFLLARLAWHAAGLLAAAHRAGLTGAVLAAAGRRPARGGGVVWVLPAAEVAAHTCGLRRPRAVVTTGLLGLLDPAEQQAVCEHEAAHLRLGHPRLLLFGATVARAYRFLPPARGAWSGLRRDLEAAADDEAARLLGAAPLVSALARVALARGSAAHPGAGFADPEHLRYRIARLQQPRPSRPARNTLFALGALGLAAAYTLAACALAVAALRPVPVLACLSPLIIIGLRPLWAARRTHIRS